MSTQTATPMRFERKHQQIVDAATAVFVKQGYDGTNMEQIATTAGVSKQTVYRHFADKESLFAEIVLSTTNRVDGVVSLVADSLNGSKMLKRDLGRLAREFITALMNPQLLRVRRLVIANADRMPELGRTWYQQGFERVLATLASSFTSLTSRGLLSINDPLIAAHHFVGLVLWIPVNQAMFTGNERPYSQTELDSYADCAVSTFLAAYGAKRKK